MSEHHARISWGLSTGDFQKGTYSREHTWSFDGGLSVPASPAPSVVRPPYSNPANVDPEEAFVASLSSCHMLFFLHLASKAGHVVTSYEDAAVGRLMKSEEGFQWMAEVELHPTISYAGSAPNPEEVSRLHEAAHRQCFISNSVKTQVRVLSEP